MLFGLNFFLIPASGTSLILLIRDLLNKLSISFTLDFKDVFLNLYLCFSCFQIILKKRSPSFQPVFIWQLKKDYFQRGLVKKKTVLLVCLLVGNHNTVVKSWALLESGFSTDELSHLKLVSQPLKGSTFSSLKWRYF